MSRAGPCLCGDTECPSCGSLQGTYRAPKSPFERTEQRNRLFAKFAGPGSHRTSERNKRRIFNVLFGA
jgi:hypothetical protein